MLFRNRLCGLAALVCILLNNTAPAQDDSAKEKSGPEKSTAEKSVQDEKSDSKGGSAQSSDSTYLELMNEWKTKEDKLKALEAEHSAVGQARKNQIRVEYNKILGEVKTLVADLRRIAIDTYRKNPNQDESLVRLLVGMLTDDLHKNRLDDFFTLGDVLISGKCDVKHFKALHDSKRLGAFGIEYKIDELIARHADGIKGDLPRAVIKTSHGDIEIELFEDAAPNHVANFISLASEKFYDGSLWHRVDPVQNVIQAGQNKDGKELDYTIAGEWDNPNRRRHFKGIVGAARTSDPNSASSQFYITTDATPGFDNPQNSYTVFGRVLSGMEVVHQIKKDDKILTVEITRKREHEYVPVPYKPGETPADPGKNKGPDKSTGEKTDGNQDKKSEAKAPENKAPENKAPENKSAPEPAKTEDKGNADKSEGAKEAEKTKSAKTDTNKK